MAHSAIAEIDEVAKGHVAICDLYYRRIREIVSGLVAERDSLVEQLSTARAVNDELRKRIKD